MESTVITTNPEELAWLERESIRELMHSFPFMTVIAALATITLALQYYGTINPLMFAFWILSAVAVAAYRLYMTSVFKEEDNKEDDAAQIVFFNKTKITWPLNAFLWGSLGWFIFYDIPVQNKYIAIIFLIYVGFFAVQKNFSCRQISNQSINVLIGTQILGIAWFVINSQFTFNQLSFFYLVGLIVNWFVLRIYSKRLYFAFKKNKLLQFRNNNLIRAFNLKTEQLEHEKHVALNANEVIQRFYSSAAHDIRQPVYALLVYAEMATNNPEQIPSLLPKMTASCLAINNLFDSLFDFEKINAGNINVVHQNVDIGEVIHDLESKFKSQAEFKNLQFRTQYVAGYLQTDQLLLNRILTCFVVNAIKYTEHGGILIAVRKKATQLVFEVWDTGIGIAPTHLPHIFDEFYKVEEQSSANEGFGLGLSVVKRLSAYAENSSISVNSRLGRGSVFRFAVPLKVYIPPYIHSRFNHIDSSPIVIDYDIT